MAPHLCWVFRKNVGFYTYDRPDKIEFRFEDKGKYHFEVRAGGRCLGSYALAENRIEELLPKFLTAVFSWPGLTYPEAAYWFDWKDWP